MKHKVVNIPYIPPFKVYSKVFTLETADELAARFLENKDNMATNIPDGWEKVQRYRVVCYNGVHIPSKYNK